MPTYDYACQACGHAFEAFQSMTAKPLKKCPDCGGMKLRRLIGTGAGIIFKGSGFYETDYRSEGYKKAAEAEKKTDSGDAGGEKKSGDARGAQGGGDGGASAKPEGKAKDRAASGGSDKPKPAKGE